MHVVLQEPGSHLCLVVCHGFVGRKKPLVPSSSWSYQNTKANSQSQLCAHHADSVSNCTATSALSHALLLGFLWATWANPTSLWGRYRLRAERRVGRGIQSRRHRPGAVPIDAMPVSTPAVGCAINSTGLVGWRCTEPSYVRTRSSCTQSTGMTLHNQASSTHKNSVLNVSLHSFLSFSPFLLPQS
jgi:hypothetical protein